ncbi:MAG TPA: penicillin-binding protein 2, partial [Ilumatobacteraceae bacterium]|nr:penicillin-binding protein 2 [Ilumatobacteraceae bacterium]
MVKLKGLALLVAVIGRVVLLQTTQASALQKAGKQQRTSERILKAQRGTIFAADGAELALSVPSSTIIANPKLVTDPAGTAATLAALLKLSPAKQTSLQEAFTQKQTSFVYVVRQIDPSLAATVDGLRLAGVDVLAEEHRTMPSGAVGKSVLGRTDIDGIGIAGLERQFDQMLTGIDGERVTEHDRQGRSIAGSGTTTKAPVAGEDLVLTIDRSLQYQVEQALLARVDEPSVMAKGGTVVVMDTKSGNIRAIANVRRNDQGVAEITSANLAAVEARDPGSVAKVFSIAAAIDSGMVTPDTYFEVPGTYTFDRGTSYERTIRDAEPHNTESYSVRQIMTKSSNIGTMMVAGRMTPEQLHDYQAAFGFGSKTALDFPDETPGILRAADTLRGSEVATVSYGYGFSVSSLQLIAGVNTIANRGTYVAPRLVEATIDRGGERVGAAPSITRQVVKPETAAEMTSIMTDVVCRGTAKQARMDGVVSVAGKT